MGGILARIPVGFIAISQSLVDITPTAGWFKNAIKMDDLRVTGTPILGNYHRSQDCEDLTKQHQGYLEDRNPN